MPRRARRIPSQQPLHICNRSAGQITIYHSVADYIRFEICLKEMLEKFPLRLFAFCIMPNHWHLLLEAESGKKVSEALHWLATTHAVRLRKDNGSTGKGAVYQNRFRAYPVQKNGAFYRVAHYIERNPVDAHLCKSPEEWKWSSANSQAASLLTLSDWPLTKPRNWLETVRQPLDEINRSQIQDHETSQRPLGSSDWIAALQV